LYGLSGGFFVVGVGAGSGAVDGAVVGPGAGCVPFPRAGAVGAGARVVGFAAVATGATEGEDAGVGEEAAVLVAEMDAAGVADAIDAVAVAAAVSFARGAVVLACANQISAPMPASTTTPPIKSGASDRVGGPVTGKAEAGASAANAATLGCGIGIASAM